MKHLNSRTPACRQRGHMDLSGVALWLGIGACVLGAGLIVAGAWLLWHGVRLVMGTA